MTAAMGQQDVSARCTPAELRQLFLFEHLTDAQLEWLCREGTVTSTGPGVVYAEGDPAESLFVLLEGTMVLYRSTGGDEVEVTRTSGPGSYAGAFYAYLGDRVPQVYNNTLRVTEPSRLFVLGADKFAQLMAEWFPMAVHLLEGLFFGVKNAQEVIGQRERLLALGSLSAGLTHELNNPAAAAVRATAALRGQIAAMRAKLAAVASGDLAPDTLATLVGLQTDAAERASRAPDLSPIQTADREDAAADWLDANGVGQSWELAPIFVQAGLDIDWLDHVAASMTPCDPDTGGQPGGPKLEASLRWLATSVETELALAEIEDSVKRISALVAKARQYSQLDRAPFQIADVRELLESTLVMLSGKVAPGITVIKQFDHSLPAIACYPAELNQVWTNLIDNALDAMNGTGTLTIRTATSGEDRILVEIGDTGPGVPDDIRERIFEPFFTTKPVGHGTGLGLDISWRIVVGRHHGDLRLESVPGDTRFKVQLPIAGGDDESQ